VRFWQSRACGVSSGLAVLAAFVLLFTALAFDYTAGRWGAATWVAVALLGGCLLASCCFGGDSGAKGIPT
jgi:hypothetical protein